MVCIGNFIQLPSLEIQASSVETSTMKKDATVQKSHLMMLKMQLYKSLASDVPKKTRWVIKTKIGFDSSKFHP